MRVWLATTEHCFNFNVPKNRHTHRIQFFKATFFVVGVPRIFIFLVRRKLKKFENRCLKGFAFFSICHGQIYICSDIATLCRISKKQNKLGYQPRVSASQYSSDTGQNNKTSAAAITERVQCLKSFAREYTNWHELSEKGSFLIVALLLRWFAAGFLM